MGYLNTTTNITTPANAPIYSNTSNIPSPTPKPKTTSTSSGGAIPTTTASSSASSTVTAVTTTTGTGAGTGAGTASTGGATALTLAGTISRDLEGWMKAVVLGIGIMGLVTGVGVGLL